MQDWKVWKKEEPKRNDIARKMLANGLSIEQIALITGLTEQEIKGL